MLRSGKAGRLPGCNAIHGAVPASLVWVADVDPRAPEAIMVLADRLGMADHLKASSAVVEMDAASLVAAM